MVALASETDFAGFRAAARELLAAHRAPDEVVWSVAGEAEPDLLAAGASAADAANDEDREVEPSPAMPESKGEAAGPSPGTAAAPLRVNAAFLGQCEQAALHRDPSRWALIYRLLWRLQREPGLRDDPLDADMTRLVHMAQAVRRDIHKMRAFVRFREVAQGEGQPPLHVAWFEPEHRIVETNAGFFMRRFAGMQWAILTPERCVRWDGQALAFSPGTSRQDAPSADSGEALWLTYYQSIFNPARLKLRAMEKEMPRRYWRNLPEAGLISELAARSAERTGAMVEQAPTTPRRRIPIASPEPSKAADPPGSLEALREAALGCRECPLGALATQTVFGEGPQAARLMLVGEQPGDCEDLAGRPFVGPAGELLMRAMAELGWPRDAVYITNAVKHFKYELRGRRRIHKSPAQKEADACLHWLESEIALVKPRALVALGATAARQLMGRAVAVARERGQWLVRDDGLRVLITLHPSALLRMEPAQFDAAYAAWLADLRLGDALD
jgi:DNA polymerase